MDERYVNMLKEEEGPSIKRSAEWKNLLKGLMDLLTVYQKTHHKPPTLPPLIPSSH